jgi:hypothetical protein
MYFAGEQIPEFMQPLKGFYYSKAQNVEDAGSVNALGR